MNSVQSRSEAGSIIVRACQKYLAGERRILKKPIPQFFQWLGQIAKQFSPVFGSSRTLDFQAKIASLFERRIVKRWDCALFFSKLGRYGQESPCYTIENIADLEEMKSENGVYYSDEAYEKLKSYSPTILKTKEEVDQLLPLISDLSFIPWDVIWDGCHIRTFLAGQILLHSGIDQTQIFKQYIFGALDYEWKYHLAIGIELETVHILDPTFSSTTSFKLNDWIKNCKKNFRPRHLLEGQNNMVFSPLKTTVTSMRVKLGERQKADEVGGRIIIEPLTEKIILSYLHTFAHLKLQQSMQNSPQLRQTLSLGDRKIPDFSPKRFNAKLEEYCDDATACLPLTAKEIEEIALYNLNIDDLFDLVENLDFYQKSIRTLPVSEAHQQAILLAIARKILEIKALIS